MKLFYIHYFEDLEKIVYSRQESPRLLLAGPCGVGKTTIARLLCKNDRRISQICMDELKEKYSYGKNPCSVLNFDFEKCLGPIIGKIKDGFVIDTPGLTIFNTFRRNMSDVNKIKQAKDKYSFEIIMLVSTREKIIKGYMNKAGSSKLRFDEDWHDWKKYEAPCWNYIKDYSVSLSKSEINLPNN